MYLLLARFVRRASDTIDRQQAALSSQVSRLTDLLQQNAALHERVQRAAARRLPSLNASYAGSARSCTTARLEPQFGAADKSREALARAMLSSRSIKSDGESREYPVNVGKAGSPSLLVNRVGASPLEG
jgi:hypothetical protein